MGKSVNCWTKKKLDKMRGGLEVEIKNRDIMMCESAVSADGFCMKRKRKYKGALYVYILVVMLVVTTLSFIIALLFDNNLKNAVIQRDSLQLYYYSKAGADWAVDLINSSSANLKITGATESLLEQIKKMPYSSVDSSAVWKGQNDLMVDGEKAGHFKVEVDKIKRTVNKDNELDPTGTRERDYARVISTGSYADGTKLSKEDYTMTVLVPLDAPTEILYLIGRK